MMKLNKSMLVKLYGMAIVRLMEMGEDKFFLLDKERRIEIAEMIEEFEFNLMDCNVSVKEFADFMDLDPAEMVDMMDTITYMADRDL